VDDTRAVEVVGRDLAAHLVAGQDADAEAAHLAGDVTEHRVAVLELDPEHRVREGLDDLALELDLLLLGHGGPTIDRGSEGLRGPWTQPVPVPPVGVAPPVFLPGGGFLSAFGAGWGGVSYSVESY